MMNNKTRRIDLHLPRGWSECTTEQLEMIAAAIIGEQQRVDRYHPFDWQRVKLNVALAINGITVLRDNNISNNTADSVPSGSCVPLVASDQRSSAPAGESEWLLRRRTDKSPWPVSTGQLLALTEHLAWLDDPKAAMPRLLFPYPRRIRRWSWRVWHRDYYAPGELLDGMSWQTYRWLNDWLDAYTVTNNQLTAALHSTTRQNSAPSALHSASRFCREEIKSLIRQEHSIRLTVLSLIFGCPKWRVRAARFTEAQWQVVLFWWSSMMQYLKQQYPKCYKTTKTRKSKGSGTPLPIELYTQSMAVLVTDLKLTEDEVNRLTAHVVLRRLNMMAEEADELEKIKHKK